MARSGRMCMEICDKDGNGCISNCKTSKPELPQRQEPGISSFNFRASHSKGNMLSQNMQSVSESISEFKSYPATKTFDEAYDRIMSRLSKTETSETAMNPNSHVLNLLKNGQWDAAKSEVVKEANAARARNYTTLKIGEIYNPEMPLDQHLATMKNNPIMNVEKSMMNEIKNQSFHDEKCAGLEHSSPTKLDVSNQVQEMASRLDSNKAFSDLVIDDIKADASRLYNEAQEFKQHPIQTIANAGMNLAKEALFFQPAKVGVQISNAAKNTYGEYNAANSQRRREMLARAAVTLGENVLLTAVTAGFAGGASKLGLFARGIKAGHAISVTESEFYKKAKLIGRYDYENPGLLPNDLSKTFTGSRYNSYVLTDDVILQRAGTANRPFGQSFSFDPPISELQTRIDKAIRCSYKPIGNC